MTENKMRYPIVDFLRGIAIVLMIFFHFFFDLTLFGYTNIDFTKDLFWFVLPRIIVFLFLLCVGLSLEIVHHEKIKKKSFFKRWWKIALGAVVISLVTYLFFRESWIYFGTLHCIAVGQLIGLLFIRRPKLSLIVASVSFLVFFISKFELVFPSSNLIKGRTMDFIPIFPWAGIILFGIYFYHLKLHHIPLKKNSLTNGVNYLGRHSLIIYLIHQPLLFSSVYLFSKIQASGIFQ